MPLRILSVANCPALEHLGSGYIIAGFLSGMRALGHRIDFISPNEHELLKWMRPRANSYRQAGGILFATRKAVRANRYDIVEFWGGEAFLAIWHLSRSFPRPLIIQHSNGPEPRYNRMLQDAGVLKLTMMQQWYASHLVPKAFELPDAIVTISRSDNEWLEQAHLPRTGRRLAIEVPLAQAFLGRPRAARAAVIGYCGTWLPKKGIAVLVADITRVLREFPDWRFLVLGTGPEARVTSYFPEDVWPRLEVVPMISDKEELAKQYERMDIFVLPSVIESFGVALAEAMACGCAPVATRVGFAASLEHGSDALLMERSASPHLYDAVKRLIVEPDLRRHVAARALARVQSLRWDLAAQTLANTYEEWLREHRQSMAARDQRA